VITILRLGATVWGLAVFLYLVFRVAAWGFLKLKGQRTC